MITVRTLSLPRVIASHAFLTPNAEAVVCDAQRLTWKQLVDRVNRIANGLLAQGLRPGDKVATLLNNSVEQLELILGTIAARGVIVPLSELMASKSLAAMLKNSEARYLFASEETRHRIEPINSLLTGIEPKNLILIDKSAPGWTVYSEWLRPNSSSSPAVDYRHDDPVSILYTSGTTGTPKGMEHSHFSRLLYPLGLGPYLEIDRHARTILTTPLYHNGTWTTMLPTLYFGGVVVIMKKFSANAFQDMVERERCTHAFMVPNSTRRHDGRRRLSVTGSQVNAIDHGFRIALASPHFQRVAYASAFAVPVRDLRHGRGFHDFYRTCRLRYRKGRIGRSAHPGRRHRYSNPRR